jgi:putative peptidoglycan lipid II flippase
MVAVGLNPIVDKTMASWLGEGSVSVLHYADRLYSIPVLFITSGLMVALLSHWSERFYESGEKRLKEDVIKSVKVVGFITLPIMLFLIFFHQPIVNLAFGRGTFAQERLPEVGWVWVCYLLGFVPYITGIVFVRAHLVLKNTMALLHLSIANCAFNIFLNYILMQRYSVKGIALSTSITSLIITSGLIITFMRKIKSVQRI